MKELIDVSGLIGREFRYKSKYGGIINDTISSAWISYHVDETTIDTTKAVRTLADAIRGYKMKPVIMIKSSNGIVYEVDDTVTIKM